MADQDMHDLEGIHFNAKMSEAEKREVLRQWLADQAARRARKKSWLTKLAIMTMAFVFAVPAMAAAAPVFAFLLGPSGLALFSGTTLSIVSSVLGFGASLGASYLIGTLFYEEPEEATEGVRLDIATGDAVPQSFIMGTYATAGSLVYAGTFGHVGKTPNTYLVQVIAVGDLPYSALNQKGHFNSIRSDIDLENNDNVAGNNFGHRVNKFIRGGKPYLWVKFKDGTQTTQDPYLAAVFNGLSARSMDANFVGRGRAYIILTARFNPDLFDDVPTAVLSYDGIKLYDPRKDSTNGGTGSHRYGVYSTYEFTANNKVIHYNGKRGIFWGDNAEWMWGGQGLPEFLFDNDTWFAAMNACDENVDLKAGGTEKTHRMGCEISCASDYADWSETLDRCTNARTSLFGGVYKTYVGAPGASVFSFTDDDILATLETNNKFIPAQEEIFNAAVGEYVEPDENWQTKSTKPKVIAEYLAEDGDEREETRISLPFITKNSRAQRIVTAMLRESRRTRTHLIALGPDAFRVESLDVVSWTSSKEQYTNKKFLVGDVQPFRAQGYIVLALRECDATDFSWTPITDEDDDEVIDPDDPDDTVQVGMPVTVSAIAVKDGNGNNRIPAIKINWDETDEDLSDIRWVEYQVRLLDTTDDDIPGGRALFYNGKVIFSEGILKNEFYQVRVKPIPFSDRPTDYGSWIDVTPDQGEGDDDIPPDFVATPTLTLRTRVDKDGKIRRILKVDIDLTGRSAKETYRVRITDTTETPDDVENKAAPEFPYAFDVLAAHDYVVRVVPVSKSGVIGNPSAPATPVGFTMPIPKKSNNVPAVGTVTLTPGHRKIIVEFPAVDVATYPEYKYTEVQRDTSTLFSSPKVHKVWSNAWTDNNLTNIENKFYRVRHVDSDDNPGAWSATVNSTTVQLGSGDVGDGAITENKTETGAPSLPGSLSLSTGAADVDQDGKMDPILLASWGSPSASVKSIVIDIYRASTSGGSYSFWDSVKVDGQRTSKRITNINTKFWYKIEIFAVGWNEKRSSGSGLTGAVSPTKRSLNLPVGSVVCVYDAYRRKNVVRVTNAPVNDPEFHYLEIYRKTGVSTFTLIHKGKEDVWTDVNPPSNTTGYRAKLYDITSNPSSDFTSAATPANASDPNANGVDDIVTQDVAALQITAAKLSSSAVTRSKLAHNIVEAQEVFNGASTNDNVIAAIDVIHGDGTDNADHVLCLGSFINNEGSPRTNIDVQLERSGGTNFSNQQCSLEDDGIATIFGVIGAGSLSGSGTSTLQLRVSGTFSKKDRHMVALPVW